MILSIAAMLFASTDVVFAAILKLPAVLICRTSLDDYALGEGKTL